MSEKLKINDKKISLERTELVLVKNINFLNIQQIQLFRHKLTAYVDAGIEQ